VAAHAATLGLARTRAALRAAEARRGLDVDTLVEALGARRGGA
jgi:hypothetical protein